MAAPKTDTSGQVVQPRAITHFGDGDTPLTNRDISLDLKALVDETIKGLLRSIGDAGAAPTNYAGATLLKLLKDIGVYSSVLADDSTKGLLRSIGDAGAAPTNYTSKTVLKLLEDIRAAVAAGLGLPLADKIVSLTTVSVPAASTVSVPWQPAAGEVWQFSYAWAKLYSDTVNSWLRFYLQGDGTLQTPRLAATEGGTELELSYAASSPLYCNNGSPISVIARNENPTTAKDLKYLISGVKVK